MISLEELEIETTALLLVAETFFVSVSDVIDLGVNKI